jgi:hypothetical protein
MMLAAMPPYSKILLLVNIATPFALVSSRSSVGAPVRGDIRPEPSSSCG